MSWLHFGTFPLLVNLAIFALAAICVWFAGMRLAEYADAIGVRTGLSHAFLGMVLLGVGHVAARACHDCDWLADRQWAVGSG